MTRLSRRSLARWAAAEFIAGRPAQHVAKRLAAAMIEDGMADQAEFLIEDILWELEKGGVLAVAKVTSARPLSKQLESALKSQLKKATAAADIVLESNVDKAAIGGLRIETAGKVWDQTVKRKLTQLREVF